MSDDIKAVPNALPDYPRMAFLESLHRAGIPTGDWTLLNKIQVFRDGKPRRQDGRIPIPRRYKSKYHDPIVWFIAYGVCDHCGRTISLWANCMVRWTILEVMFRHQTCHRRVIS